MKLSGQPAYGCGMNWPPPKHESQLLLLGATCLILGAASYSHT
jgi:hypothetical protein